MNTIDTIRGYIRDSSPFATIVAGTGAALTAVAKQLEIMRARHHSRLALLDMTDEQLEDIGITRSQALKEAHRPFWDSLLGGYGR